MRHVTLVAIVLSLLAGAACSHENESTATTPAGSSGRSDEGGTVGMVLAVPEAWTVETKGNRTSFFAGAGKHFSVWAAPAGTTEAEAIEDLGTTLAAAVQDFEVVSEEEVEVAGTPAHHIFGKGVEADDGDDSVAEVYVFPMGGRVRIVCVHGEGKAAEILRPDVLAILETARAADGR